MPPRSIVLVSLASLVIAPFAIWLAIHPDPEFLFYGVVLLFEIVAVIWMDRRVHFSLIVLIGLGTWAVAHLAGGTMSIPLSITEPGRPATLYNMRLHPALPKYDMVVHACGFGIATLAAWEALRVHTRRTLRPALPAFVALTLTGCGLGALNEMIEFIATRIMPETNVGGYDNTGWDLISNFVGCAGMSAIICRPRASRLSSRLA
jgi:hypothetical protein